MLLSLVIPVFNEVDSLAQLHAEIDKVCQQHQYAIDLVFVDDGSTDGSWEVIDRLARNDSRVRGIRFRRNFGKAAALNAGFAAAVGDYVLTLDADLQDDPQEIPRFIAMAQQGCDVVSGWKRTRHDPWHKVLPSRVFNWMVSYLTGVRLHDHNCGFKCYRHEALRDIHLYGELHRFVPVLAASRGWQVAELEVHHRARRFGVSKYGIGRIPKGFLDLLTVKLITGYGHRPQHMLGAFGLCCFLCGSVGMFWLTLAWCVTRLPYWSGEVIHLHTRAIFYYSLAAVILGGQFMSVGFLAELMTSLYGSPNRFYTIAERLGGDSTWRLGKDDRSNLPSSSERQLSAEQDDATIRSDVAPNASGSAPRA